jgi:phosphatidylglycerophosphate synthase
VAPGGLTVQTAWDKRVARALVSPLAQTSVTPNHVTAISLVVGLTGALLIALGGAAMHWGALLFMVACLLDHADGELARMTDQTSRFGHVFDVVTDGVIHVALFLGIGFGLRDTGLGAWAVPMGVAASLAVLAIFILRFKVERQTDSATVAQPTFAGFEIEDVMYLIGPIIWLGGLVPFLVLACIGAPAFLVYQVWAARARHS